MHVTFLIISGFIVGPFISHVRFKVFVTCSRHLCLPWRSRQALRLSCSPSIAPWEQNEPLRLRQNPPENPPVPAVRVPLYLLPVWWCLIWFTIIFTISNKAPPAPTFLRFWPPVLAKLEGFCLWPFCRNIITGFNNCEKARKGFATYLWQCL